MGKCSYCGKKIKYNNYVIKYGKIYHPECRKKELAEKIVKPTKKAQEAMESMGITEDGEVEEDGM